MDSQQLRHVLWIGGPPAVGKTTIATRLARRYGLRLYSADTRTWEHRDRAIGDGVEAAILWEAMTPVERRMRSSQEQLAMSLHGERGSMVVEDLLNLPRSPLVVAEGTTLPAHRAHRSRAVWLIPTPEFQRQRLAERELDAGTMALYELLAETIKREAEEAEIPVIAVDGSRDVDAMAAAVEEQFADALATGPRAGTRSERRLLLREANEATVAQVFGYFSRPWAIGEPAARDFLCECGMPECSAVVHMAVAQAAAGAVRAAGHL
jgi:AAA domain